LPAGAGREERAVNLGDWVVLRWLRRKTSAWLRDFAHPPGGRWGRARRRYLLLSALLATIAAVAAFPDNAAKLAAGACRVSVAQPGLSDLCGGLGLPGIPARDERLAWERIEPGDCEALAAHVERFPAGVHRAAARDRLSFRRSVRAPDWREIEREVGGYVRQGTRPAARAVAVRDVEARALADLRADPAPLGCAPTDEYESLLGAELTRTRPECRAVDGGYLCGLDFTAQCRLRARPLVDRCG
jgi:hypothetical protein